MISIIVGKVDINLKELEKCSWNYDKFIEYSDSLVPEEFRHIKAITDNQRYLCAVRVRKLSNIPWDVRADLVNRVMQEVSIVGYADQLIEAVSLHLLVNKEKVFHYLEKGRKYK